MTSFVVVVVFNKQDQKQFRHEDENVKKNIVQSYLSLQRSNIKLYILYKKSLLTVNTQGSLHHSFLHLRSKSLWLRALHLLHLIIEKINGFAHNGSDISPHNFSPLLLPDWPVLLFPSLFSLFFSLVSVLPPQHTLVDRL